MKRLTKSYFLLALTIMLFSSCSVKEINFVKPRESSQKDSSIETEDSSKDKNNVDEFNFSANLNVLIDENETLVPIENEISILEEKDIKLTLLNLVEPDDSQIQKDIPVRIFLIADGDPLLFSIDNSDMALFNDLSIDSNVEQYNIVNFRAGPEVHLISIICIYFPSDIPERGLASYSGEISYTITNTNSTFSDNTKAFSQSYIEVEHLEDNYGIDIGELSIKENENKIVENHFYTDLEITDRKKKIYLKFNNGVDNDMSYYLLVLFDGNLINAFDGKYHINVDCMLGKRSFQYVLSPDLFTDETGLHTLQLIALPSKQSENLTSYSTPKIRINIKN